MTTAIVLLIILAAVAYALQRNHARQANLWSTYAGSTTAEDRDAERVRTELDALSETRYADARGSRTAGYSARHIRPRQRAA